jgi:ankyrin repeat protein
MRLTDDAFRFAAYEGKIELLREGLAAGNYVNAPDPQKQLTALHMAAYNGHTEAIKLLLEHGATIDARDTEGKTALLHACTGPFPEAVKVLLDAGADINTTETTEAFTPLMMAAGLGQTAVVKILLERKANKALMDSDGDTALKHAQNSQHAEIVQLLQD